MKQIMYLREPAPIFAKVHLETVDLGRAIPNAILSEGSPVEALTTMFGVLYFKREDRTVLGQYLRRLAGMVDDHGTGIIINKG